MADTWGIPGPTFLALYAATAAVVLVATLILRSRAFAGPERVRIDQLTPQHTAYLAGGPARAVYASLAFLRQHGVLESESSGRLRRTGGLPPGASPLDAAVLHAAGNGVRSADLRTDHSVASALNTISADLERNGLAVSAETVARARRGRCCCWRSPRWAWSGSSRACPTTARSASWCRSRSWSPCSA
ncbi:TIGR04222 domain-containing membrane protein [Catellatospora bangladeshensis]|uniref:TIGR04222 domain-containing membrane protein n=1 Tax=Catellatospora bangladeshensis TaxID=310355 RepID=UPI003608A171